jgi:hypothetical protein
LEERIYFKLRARFGTVGGQLNAFVQRSNWFGIYMQTTMK